MSLPNKIMWNIVAIISGTGISNALLRSIINLPTNTDGKVTYPRWYLFLNLVYWIAVSVFIWKYDGSIKQIKKARTKTMHETIIEIENESVFSEASEQINELRKWKELLDDGVITEEEFNQKKKQLLGLD